MKVLHKSLFFIFAVILIMIGGKAQGSSQPYIPAHQINFGTGNKYLSATDVKLSSPTGTLSFTRTYNSQSDTTSVMGFGWTTTFTEHLIIAADSINLVQKGGRHVTFKNDGTGNWSNQTSAKRIITENAGGYQLKEPDGTIRQYDGTGNLITITDSNNNIRTYTYSGGLVSTISDNFGRSLTFTYTDGKLTQVSSALGTFTYSYRDDNLTSVDKPDGSNIQYIYDDPNDTHNLTGVIDETGTRILTVGYDTQDRAISSAKEDGTDAVTITYPTTTSREVTNSLGVKTTCQLDVLHGIAMVGSMTGPGCSSCGGNANTSYVYNARLQITEATDANGVKTDYTYDEPGNTTGITKAFGSSLAETITKTYDPVTNKTATISQPSVANPGQQQIILMTYDPENGNLLTRQQDGYSGTNAITATTHYSYNTYGQITLIDGPRTDVNDTVSLIYYPNQASEGNNRGNLHTITNALGQTTTYENYNAFGEAQTVTDPNGIVTSRLFDQNGLITSSTTAGLATVYMYFPNGRLQTVTLPGDRVITYGYSSAGRLATITDNLGNSIDYTYDTEGRRTGEMVYDPQNTLTRYAGYDYDDYGRLNKVTYPGNAWETAEYDLVGNLMRTINPISMQTDYSYDDLDRLLSVTVAGSPDAGYSYDTQGNVVTVTDGNYKTTNFTYDDFGRRIAQTSPDTGGSTYDYDPAGNLIAVTDAKGQSTSYQYDALNRPVSRSYAGGSAIVFTYDQGANAIGRLSEVTDREGTDSFAYDNAGRILTETRVIGITSHSIGYIWDPATGDLFGMTYPSGLILSYSRDAGGGITAISANGTPLVTAISHLPFGPVKAALLGSVDLVREFDQRYAVTHISTATLDYAYARDPGSRVEGITGIKSPAVVNESVDYSYNTANNQLTGHSGSSPKNYIYDDNGNIISDGTFTFVYDGLNRLVQVKQGADIIAIYGYDAGNRRIRKTVGATTTHYLYDLNSNLIAETQLDGTPIREYIYLDSEPIAVKEYQGAPGTYYYINDHLGTPQQLVNSTGTIVWQAAYLPFGKAQVISETVKNNLRFPGQYYDAETGLHYNWHRFYDPETGRYISADPIGLAGGMNLYSYVNQDPINWIDPEGLDALPTPIGPIPLPVPGTPGPIKPMPVPDLPDISLPPSIGDIAISITLVMPFLSDESKCSEDDKCEKQLARDDATCAAISNAEKKGKRPKGAAQRCYSSAMERYGNCLAGRPLGPLDTWNN